MNTENKVIENSYDIIMYQVCKNGNINGDPDNEGRPRVDILTGHGIATDVSIKRHIRDYITAAHGLEDGYKMYISDESSLNEKDEQALQAVGINDLKDKKKANEKDKAERDILSYLTRTYADVRLFGGVFTTFTKANLRCSRVRGPVQIDIATSLDPVVIQTLTISRCAISNADEAVEKASTFGKRYVVPFAVYEICIHISGVQAQKVGMTQQDLEYLLEALSMYLEETRSSMRGDVHNGDMYVFKHQSKLRDCTFSAVHNAIRIERRKDIPECYEDYSIRVDESLLPKNVTFQKY